MLFNVVTIGVPVLVYLVVPKLLKADRAWRWLLLAACFIMFISWFLPSPLVCGQETQFTTHFVGGGIFTGLLWLYIKLVKKWNERWWVEAASLFALVSALGVFNELFEVGLHIFGHMQNISDTSWDLVANTLGAMTFFVVYKLAGVIQKKH